MPRENDKPKPDMGNLHSTLFSACRKKKTQANTSPGKRSADVRQAPVVAETLSATTSPTPPVSVVTVDPKVLLKEEENGSQKEKTRFAGSPFPQQQTLTPLENLEPPRASFMERLAMESADKELPSEVVAELETKQSSNSITSDEILPSGKDINPDDAAKNEAPSVEAPRDVTLSEELAIADPLAEDGLVELKNGVLLSEYSMSSAGERESSLRLMAQVKQDPLSPKHSFQTNDLLDSKTGGPHTLCLPEEGDGPAVLSPTFTLPALDRKESGGAHSLKRRASLAPELNDAAAVMAAFANVAINVESNPELASSNAPSISSDLDKSRRESSEGAQSDSSKSLPLDNNEGYMVILDPSNRRISKLRQETTAQEYDYTMTMDNEEPQVEEGAVTELVPKSLMQAESFDSSGPGLAQVDRENLNPSSLDSSSSGAPLPATEGSVTSDKNGAKKSLLKTAAGTDTTPARSSSMSSSTSSKSLLSRLGRRASSMFSRAKDYSSDPDLVQSSKTSGFNIDSLIARLLESKGPKALKKTLSITKEEIIFICQKCLDVVMSQPNLLELSAPVHVAGVAFRVFLNDAN